MTAIENVESFCHLVSKIADTDRWILLICDGDMGEGKSCLTDQISQGVAKCNKTPFSHDANMTYSRKELKKWIDGEGAEHKGQKPEKSVLLVDELISLFFKRNWHDTSQIDGIELLNKCRDRHLIISGNIPNFWDLDSAIFPLVTFWVHVHERGRAWVFQRDQNPFTNDKWHRSANEKAFRKYKNPYKCEGFVCELQFNDWTPEEKEAYYLIRNEKRRNTEGQRDRMERYANVKKQRDDLIRFIFTVAPQVANRTLAEITDMSDEYISMVKNSYHQPMESVKRYKRKRKEERETLKEAVKRFVDKDLNAVEPKSTT